MYIDHSLPKTLFINRLTLCRVELIEASRFNMTIDIVEIGDTIRIRKYWKRITHFRDILSHFIENSQLWQLSKWRNIMILSEKSSNTFCKKKSCCFSRKYWIKLTSSDSVLPPYWGSDIHFLSDSDLCTRLPVCFSCHKCHQHTEYWIWTS